MATTRRTGGLWRLAVLSCLLAALAVPADFSAAGEKSGKPGHGAKQPAKGGGAKQGAKNGGRKKHRPKSKPGPGKPSHKRHRKKHHHPKTPHSAAQGSHAPVKRRPPLGKPSPSHPAKTQNVNINKTYSKSISRDVDIHKNITHHWHGRPRRAWPGIHWAIRPRIYFYSWFVTGNVYRPHASWKWAEAQAIRARVLAAQQRLEDLEIRTAKMGEADLRMIRAEAARPRGDREGGGPGPRFVCRAAEGRNRPAGPSRALLGDCAGRRACRRASRGARPRDAPGIGPAGSCGEAQHGGTGSRGRGREARARRWRPRNGPSPAASDSDRSGRRRSSP